MTPSVRSIWQELVASALVGTSRQSGTSAGASVVNPGALQTLLSAIEKQAAEPESALLGSAAAVAAYRRAGMVVESDASPLPEPAPSDDLPACSRRSGWYLAQILGNREWADHLAEWLTIGAVSGRRVRDEDLPTLLDYGRNHKELRPAIAAVVGARGRWLAVLNPDWSYVLRDVEVDLTNAEAAWQTEGRDARVALVRQLRSIDPDRARAMVESTWKEDPPADRAAFLEAFSTRLTMADEPFLEEGLDDRRAEVRRAAADLLTRLPESRLCRRMIDRSTPRILFKKGMLSFSIDVELPETCTKEMARDGVLAKVPGLGEKIAWLSQMVAAVPPSHWSELSGKSAEKLIAAAAATEWSMELRGAWALATVNHRDLDWARAFLNQKRRAFTSPKPVTYPDILACLPEKDRQLVVAKILEDPKGHPDDASWLGLINDEWGDRLSQAAFDLLDRVIAGPTGESFGPTRGILQIAAMRLSPASALRVEKRFRAKIESSAAHLVPSLEEFVQTVRFRQEMIEELSR